MRALLQSNAGHEGPTSRQLQLLGSIADTTAVRIHLDPDDYALHAVPDAHDPVDAMAVRLLLIVRDAQRDHTWARLKACSNPKCRWAYYDRSHSQQGKWCDMAVCGNRAKNRALRARRH